MIDKIKYFFVKHLSKILKIETVIFTVILFVAYLKNKYASLNPFFDPNIYSPYFSENTSSEIVFSIIIYVLFVLCFILCFAFPFIYIIQLILLKKLKSFNKIDLILCLILIPLYLVSLIWPLGELLKRPSEIDSRIHYIQLPDYNTSNILFLPEKDFSSKLDTVIDLQDDFNGKIQISKINDMHGDSIYIINYTSPNSIYLYQQISYNNRKLKEKGVYLGTMKVEKWTYYNSNGDSTIINETDKFLYKHTYQDLLSLLLKEKYIDINKAIDWDKFLIEYKQTDNLNKGNPFWYVTKKGEGMEKILLFDARTGKKIVLKLNQHK